MSANRVGHAACMRPTTSVRNSLSPPTLCKAKASSKTSAYCSVGSLIFFHFLKKLTHSPLGTRPRSRRSLIHQTSQHFGNLVEFRRLVEKEASPALKAFPAILPIAVVAQHDHHRLELILLQTLEYLDAASTRHGDIQSYDVGFHLADFLHRVRNVARVADNFYSCYFPESGGQAPNERFRIIDD